MIALENETNHNTLERWNDKQPELRWAILGYTFEIWPQDDDQYSVKIHAYNDEPFWLNEQSKFETLGGANFAILLFLEGATHPEIRGGS